jgi:hypothetical protein
VIRHHLQDNIPKAGILAFGILFIGFSMDNIYIRDLFSYQKQCVFL